MNDRTEVLAAAWAGLAGFALTIVGGVLAGEFNDPAGSSPAAIIDFYQGASFDTTYVSGVILETLGFLLAMAFVVELAEVVQGGRGRANWLGTVIVASAIVATVLTLLSEAGLAAGIFRASNGGLVGDGYVVLSDVRQFVYWVSLPAWALVLVASGLLIIRVRSFPVWLGWIAVVIGVTHIAVSLVDSAVAWDAATGCGGLWLVTFAIYMLIHPERHTAKQEVRP